MFNRLKSTFVDDSAFMGLTHGISALAIVLALTAFLPNWLDWALGDFNLPGVLLFGLVVMGGAFICDLDNTSATAISALGPLGKGLSIVFRGSSSAMQTLVRTKRDASEPNPHRGFWHTPLVGAPLLGGLVILLGRVGANTYFTPPLIGEITVGNFITLLLASLIIHVGLSGVFVKFMKKIKKNPLIGDLLGFVFSFVLTLSLFAMIPHGMNGWWPGLALTIGMIIHILGDWFTTAGVPLLFPFSAILKGKFWWTFRLTKIKAGGVVEKFIFVPVFIIVAIVSVLMIIGELAM